MPIAFWCILIALFLPYLGTGLAKFAGRDFGPRQNRDPRSFLEGLAGYRRRAHNFQLNSFEVTPAFAIAVMVAYVVGNAEPTTLDRLAMAWVISRLIYMICYLADLAMLRSLVWFIGMALIASFFVVSA